MWVERYIGTGEEGLVTVQEGGRVHGGQGWPGWRVHEGQGQGRSSLGSGLERRGNLGTLTAWAQPA